MSSLKDFLSLDWNRIFDGSAALSYYFILALFPGLLVLLSVISYVPSEIINDESLYWAIRQAPDSISDLILEVLNKNGGQQRFGLFSASLIVSMWTVSSGFSAVIRQLNASYHVEEKRKSTELYSTSLFLSIATGLLVIAPILAVVMVKFLIEFFPQAIAGSFFYLYGLFNGKYLLFLISFSALFQLIYHLGPDTSLSWKKHLPGGLIASVSFLLVTQVFEFYLNNFADYSVIYGGIGTIVVLLLWFNILGALLIFGAEINYRLSS